MDVRIPLEDWRIALKPEVVEGNEDIFPAAFAHELARGKTHFVVSRDDVQPEYLKRSHAAQAPKPR